jgi:hypothetical protein
MGGPKVPWRPGRIDGFAKDATPDGRLPDAAQGQDHLRAVSDIIPFSVTSHDGYSFVRSSIVWGTSRQRFINPR